MGLGILFGLMVLLTTSYAFFNFGAIEVNGHHSFIPIVVLTTMFTIMMVALGIYLYRNYKIKSISHWPHTQGRILDVNQKNGFFGPKLEIEYTYFMNDIQYINNDFDYFSKEASMGQVFMMPGLRDIEKLGELKDKMVRVYFRPESPYTSYISCNVVQNPLIVLLPAIVIIPSCLFLFFRIFSFYF